MSHFTDCFLQSKEQKALIKQNEESAADVFIWNVTRRPVFLSPILSCCAFRDNNTRITSGIFVHYSDDKFTFLVLVMRPHKSVSENHLQDLISKFLHYISVSFVVSAITVQKYQID